MPNVTEAPRMVRLLRMSSLEKPEFSNKVAQSRRRLYVYVHPYFPDRNNFLASKKNFRPYQEMRDVEIPALLTAGAPVVIFEESTYVRELPERIGKLPKEATVYVVSTVNGGPDPLLSTWDRVGSVFKEANVDDIYIGGAILNTFYDHINGSCVGLAAHELAGNNILIRYRLAAFSLPSPQSEILESRMQ